MARPTIRIHNTQTNEVTDREMNDTEFAQYETDKAAQALALADAKAKAAQKAALLTKLGITAEEAVLLLS
jgi:hypothetical protein